MTKPSASSPLLPPSASTPTPNDTQQLSQSRPLDTTPVNQSCHSPISPDAPNPPSSPSASARTLDDIQQLAQLRPLHTTPVNQNYQSPCLPIPQFSLTIPPGESSSSNMFAPPHNFATQPARPSAESPGMLIDGVEVARKVAE